MHVEKNLSRKKVHSPFVNYLDPPCVAFKMKDDDEIQKTQICSSVKHFSLLLRDEKNMKKCA